MQTLIEIAQKKENNTDKLTHNFLPTYESCFSAIRESTTNVLELGVFEGKSLRMWRDYFHNAHIYGVDIKKNLMFSEERISTHCFGQDQIYAWENFFGGNEKGLQFDLILDDASHVMEHQQRSLGYLFPKVKKGGYYVVEDLHTSGRLRFGCHNKIQSTKRMLRGFEDGFPLQSEFIPQHQLEYLSENIEYCKVFDTRRKGKSSTSIIKKKD
jgi:hypothetical protein